MIWTIPNALSGFRLLLGPVFLWLMTRGTTLGAVLGLTTFAVAGITDTLDGYIARKYGSDSAAVAFDAIAHAKAKYSDVVIVDTSGRMVINKDLMEEMKKIKTALDPKGMLCPGNLF